MENQKTTCMKKERNKERKHTEEIKKERKIERNTNGRKDDIKNQQ